jgi:hypothetical protein
MKFISQSNFRFCAFLSLLLISLLLSSGFFFHVPVKANGSGTTTTLSDPPPATPFGNPVDLTAKVTANSGTPTGTVEFFDGATSLGTETLQAGIAVKSIFTLGPGSHIITATYNGDGYYTVSTSNSIFVNVMFKASLTTLTVAPELSTSGQLVTLTAVVTPDSPGNVTPSGVVDFSIQGDHLTRNLSGNLDGSGTAAASLSDLPAGTYLVTAYYEGMDGYFSSTSTEFSFNVNASGPALGVGGEIQGVSKIGLISPWILLVSVFVLGGVILALKRRRTS